MVAPAVLEGGCKELTVPKEGAELPAHVLGKHGMGGHAPVRKA